MAEVEQVIFDLGNVLLDFKPRQCLVSLLKDEELAAEIYQALFASPEWVMLDRGVISQKQAEQTLVARRPDLAADLVFVFENWFPFLTPIEPNVAVLAELKRKNYRLYVLSNFHKDAFKYARQVYDWFDLFDGLLISSYHKVLKPEPAIYRLLLDKFGLQAERSLFVDDLAMNLEAARQFGIKTIHYQNPGNLRAELCRCLSRAQFELP